MDYRQVIESKYNRQNWQGLLYDIFRKEVTFWTQPQPVTLTDTNTAKNALYLGKITLSDGYVIAIYEVELSDSVAIERNRASIRNLLCTNWRGMGCAGAFMFCFRQNEASLRFSYVSESFVFAEDGSLRRESTDTKRFTYLLGEGHRSRTAIAQFKTLQKSNHTLKDVTKAFSVEALSDMFFKDYKAHYENIIEFITGKRMVKVANKWEEKVTRNPCGEIMQEFSQFPDAEKAVRDYVKKLMGRLVFLQFLQKKGWMGCSAGEAWNDGDKEFLQNLFTHSTYKDTFVDDVLEPLFNDINTKREGYLASNANVGKNIKIPYLNGGLFEKDEFDHTAFPLPSKFMKDMLDFFASYNFTIDENDPDDAEIGIDPEMLGRIFENLLEDNKDKGAFYTPKEIVQYMCRESLIAYLQTNITDEAQKDAIRNFVTTHEGSILLGDLKIEVDQKLKDVKICDPAIGSGAFPMGLLRELYACRKAIEGIDDDTAVSIKTHIIQNNIYGVDIEKGAVDIARLRFWLALIVDEKNPHALPNMDFKIMQGNSLLEQYEGIDLSGMSVNELAEQKAKKRGSSLQRYAWQPTLTFDEQDALKNIQNAIKAYYLTDDHDKKIYLREVVNNNVRSYILNLKGFTPDIKQKLENLPIPNDQFFLWHIYFKEVFDKGGFDIVIANPPYIRVQNLPHHLIDLYKKTYATAWKRVDISTLFIELMTNFLSPHGILCYITSNQFVSAEYGRLMRKYLLEKTLLSKVIDFGDLPIFENAITYVSIFFLTKDKKQTFEYYKVPKLPFESPRSFEKCSIGEFSEEPWSFVFSTEKGLLKKLQQHVPLSKIAFSKGGIITGNDDCFIFEPDNLPVENHLSLDLIRTDNINRYALGSPSLKIFYPCVLDNNGETSVLDLQQIAEKYPRAYKHIMDNADVLRARKDSRTTMGEKKNWYQPVRFGTLELFNGEKILTPGIVKHNKFVLDNVGYAFSFGNMYAIVSRGEINIKVLLGILNSKLIEFYLHCVAPVKQGGYYSYGATVLDKIPLAYPEKETENKLLALVEHILSLKRIDPQTDTSSLEKDIDDIVYKLYNLTPEEIAQVENSLK